MYFDAVITPVILGGSPGIIKPQTPARKKLTKAQSRNDTDQPSPSRSRLTLGRPHTATSYSQPVSLSPPSQPRPRSSSNALSRPPSLKKKKSMSFVSLFFNRNAQPSRSNTSSSFIDIEEKQTNPFKRSKTAVETGTPPSGPHTHRLSRSFSSTPNYHSKDNDSNGQDSLHSRPSFTPTPFATSSPTMMRRFEHASKRSSESCTNLPRTKSPSSALRQGVHGKGGPSAALPTLDVIDADASCCFDDDAYSAISSICFADDPDEKPPNKGKGRESRVASIATVTDSPVTRLDRGSLVLDISASNRISVELGDITETEAQEKEDNDIAQTWRPPYRSRDKLLSILGEFPQQHQQTHLRRHSCSTASISSAQSRWSTAYPPFGELSPDWSLPDIPVVSPLTTTTFIPSLTTQPPTPTQSSPPTSSSSNPVAVERKRHSTLLFPGADGFTAFLRPLETSDTKRFSRPFRSSTFSSSSPSTPLHPFDLSVPPMSPARTLVPQSHPSAPPGLSAHVQSCSYVEQDTLDVESEDKKGKNRAYRDSVMTQDSTCSDLHRFPSSLLDDALDSQPVRFNTAPSTPTLLSCAPPSLSTSSASESTAQSPALSFANTPHILNPTITISSSNTPTPIGTSIPARPISPTPPLSISPPRHPIRPLPQPPKSSTRAFTSLSRLNLPPTASTGIELVIDPVGSPFDPAVSPIVFASSDSDDNSFERYPGDLSDDDSVEIKSWGSQDGIEPLLEREKVGTRVRGDRKAVAKAKRKQRMKENSGWSSVRVPLRKRSSGLVQERVRMAPTATTAIHSHGRRETANWVGEWNSEIHDVIQQLRTLR